MKCLFHCQQITSCLRVLNVLKWTVFKSVLHSLLSSVPSGQKKLQNIQLVSILFHEGSNCAILGRKGIFRNFWCSNSHVLCIFTISINIFKTTFRCLCYIWYPRRHVHSVPADRRWKTFEFSMRKYKVHTSGRSITFKTSH